ncbi:MAG: hypothetical protein ACOYO1_18730 [Bacteroidales bacterium]
MRMNKGFQDATIEIFKNIFTPEQIEEMIAIDLSECDNILNLPVEKYFEKQFNIGDSINNGDNENNEIDQNEIILASYTLMNLPELTEQLMESSQGIIAFYSDAIELYITSMINCLNLSSPVGLNTSLFIHYFVMSDLLMHEGFHHYCDFKRQLTGSQFDISIEERLAVAHSYNQFSLPLIKRDFSLNYFYIYNKFTIINKTKNLHYKIRNQNMILFDFLMQEHFMSYYSSDYKNWQLFTHKNAYKIDYYNYIKNSKLDELLNLGIPVNDIQKEIDLIGVEGTTLVVV